LSLEDTLRELGALWSQEARASRQRFVDARERTPLAERVARGDALDQLEVAEMEAATGGRTMLWIVGAGADVRDLRASTGSPVVLWREDPNGDGVLTGILARRRQDRLGVMIDGELPEAFDTPGFKLDLEDPQVTFKRGRQALHAFSTAAHGTPARHIGQVLFGDEDPRQDPERAFTPHDDALNDDQRAAVAHAMAARDVALIHGPPGTGKTRTLVEVVLQALGRGERVLASAASNLAVDNLAARLIDAGVEVVRVGHPARVTEEVEARTLDALLEGFETWALARTWMDEANALRRRANTRAARGQTGRDERRQMYREARDLTRDARRQIALAERAVLDRAQVVCVTAAGAASRSLSGEEFDLLVLDESTQAPDPIALVPMTLCRRVVMAGDPMQLPPTIIDPEAARAGLGVTAFERLVARDASSVRMLTVQHRMHAEIMAFPSARMYDGRLVAADHVAGHTLEDLGVAPDPLRPGPWVFVDTAGKGWDESSGTESDPSTSNPEQAARVAAEARRILSRGLPPSDLAVIAPYHAQVRLLRGLLEAERDLGLEIATVDGFQGREKEAILVDLVRSNPDGEIGFLGDVRRMNVAMTRARRLLMVVGDSATIGGHSFYGAFLEAMEQRGAYVSAWADEAEEL
jgi:superfamily I DNA and/or RNA helicase